MRPGRIPDHAKTNRRPDRITGWQRYLTRLDISKSMTIMSIGCSGELHDRRVNHINVGFTEVSGSRPGGEGGFMNLSLCI